MDKLIVGLGNPGRQYQDTRHNIGQMVLERLVERDRLSWQSKFKGRYAVGASKEGKVFFLVPETFMNLSGESVLPLTTFFKVAMENVVVVHDELDLPYGTMALKKGGGLAGHNGLKSIAAHCGTQDFMRLRLGIGRPVHGTVSDWVLGKFLGDEGLMLDKFIQESMGAVDCYIGEGFDRASGRYSKKSILT